jgi:predicted amidohydrolase
MELIGTLKIALIQCDIAFGQPKTNIEHLLHLVCEVCERNVDLVLLPELWTTGYDLEHISNLAEPIHGSLDSPLSNMARHLNSFLCGSTLELAEGHYYNTQTLFNPRGELVAKYRKVHLFRLMHEQDFLSPGDHPVLACLPWGLAGMAVCYDLRFPDFFTRYALGGAKIILLSAEWPYPRLEHWRTLLRARAIENQSFVLACNRVGSDLNNRFFGHSMVIDPWGDVLVEGGEEEGVLFAELKMDLVDNVRKRIPVISDYRAEVYQRDPIVFGGERCAGA